MYIKLNAYTRLQNPDLKVRAMAFERQDTRVSNILNTIYKNDNEDPGQQFWRDPPLTIPVASLSGISQH